LSLNFKAGARQELTATFQSQVKGDPLFAENVFAIQYITANAFEITRPEIQVGDLTDATQPATYEFLVISPTRGPGTPEKLSPPSVRVMMPSGGGEPGAFVTVGTPIPVPDDQLPELTAELIRQAPKNAEGKQPLARVRTAYRVPVIVTPKVGEQRLDIGVLERELWVACGDAQPRLVRVKGNVHGGMWLSSGKELDLKSFRAPAGVPEARFELLTDNPTADVVLSQVEVEERGSSGQIQKVMRDHVVVNGKIAPDIVRVTIERQGRKDPDRGYFWIKITVPPEAVQGQLVNSYVVVELKGPNARRFRIPLKGGGSR
jgi:hypothetical protein